MAFAKNLRRGKREDYALRKDVDLGRVSFVQVAIQDIVVLLRFCKIIPVNLSSMLKNRGNFHATKGICHHIVTPFNIF